MLFRDYRLVRVDESIKKTTMALKVKQPLPRPLP